jgi:hypothetical protein
VSPAAKVKAAVDGALASALMSSPKLNDGLLLRWHVVAEVELPGDERALVRMSHSSMGADLRSWEAAGMLLTSLVELLFDTLIDKWRRR